MKKYYAVIDTNVLVSAFLKKTSIPKQIASYAVDGKIIPALNDAILKEYREVLHRPKFNFPRDEVDTYIYDLCQRAVFLDPGDVEIWLPDPKDVVFYAVVMEARKGEDAYLVTGNLKHFPGKMFVVTPHEMLTLVETGKMPSRD